MIRKKHRKRSDKVSRKLESLFPKVTTLPSLVAMFCQIVFSWSKGHNLKGVTLSWEVTTFLSLVSTAILGMEA